MVATNRGVETINPFVNLAGAQVIRFRFGNLNILINAFFRDAKSWNTEHLLLYRQVIAGCWITNVQHNLNATYLSRDTFLSDVKLCK